MPFLPEPQALGRWIDRQCSHLEDTAQPPLSAVLSAALESTPGLWEHRPQGLRCQHLQELVFVCQR